MNRNDKEAVALLEAKGFERDRVNSKGIHIYVNGDGLEFPFRPGVKDNRDFEKQLLRRLGEPTRANKRNPENIKAREARQREWQSLVDRQREHARLAQEAARNGNCREYARQCQLETAVDRERRELEKLMRTAPGF